jgi:uncharacterized protein YkwD
MAASGIMDHGVAGPFSSRMAGARTGMAAENIAAGTKTWAETLRMWQTSPGHSANLLQSKADIVGVAVARSRLAFNRDANVHAIQSPVRLSGTTRN